MNFNFVAMSDPHVGRTWSSHCTPATRERLRDRYLDPIQELTDAFSPAELVCGGDWFDKAHNSEQVLQASIPLMSEFSVIIAGNHDHSGREAAVTSMALIDGLSVAEGLVINDQHLNHDLFRVYDSSGICVYSVPHHGTQALFEQACWRAADHARNKESPAVLVVHANVGPIGGGKPDSCLYLTPQLMASIQEPFAFVLCGHEHLPRREGKLIVMGSTQPCNFGELGPRFFWGFSLVDGQVQVEQVPIRTQLTHAVIDVSRTNAKPQAAELVKLVGKVHISAARQVQQMVREAYANGALAVKVEVEFDRGLVADGGQVAGTMNNLVQVIQAELADNAEWLELFNAALAEKSEGKV